MFATIILVIMDASIQATCLLALHVEKCAHTEGCKKMGAFPRQWTFKQLYQQYHPGADDGTFYTFDTMVSASVDGGQPYEVDSNLTLGDCVSAFGIKYIKFLCKESQKEHLADILECINTASAEATTKAVNAFQLLMAGGKVFPQKKQTSSGVKEGLNHKDELYNDIVDWCQREGLNFARDNSEQAAYFVQVLCNALWYITNQQSTIDSAARREKDLKPIPSPFDQYTGYNDCKRKKLKALPLNHDSLQSHCQALYSLLLKPYANSTKSWMKACTSIKELASCLSLYSEYLMQQAEVSAHRRDLETPVRTIDKHAGVYHCTKTQDLKQIYIPLDTAVLAAGHNPVVFSEDVHLLERFENNKQRERYFKNIQLSVPVDIAKFCPGGSIVTTYIITQVSKDRTVPQMLTEGARLVQQTRAHLKEVNTRAQRRIFKEKISNIARVQPSLLDFIYTELSIDAAAMAYPDMMQRLRMISLGESDLLADLRHLNPGRPSDKFDIFFEKLNELVHEISAAEERRHGPGVAHLSEWISLSDMIEKATNECPEGTLIPSKSLVCLQFVPCNPYSRAALSFTSKVHVQYKIQRRQLRKQHPDDHYCAALFKYLKSKAVEVKAEAVLVCCDDKAKVPIGDPGRPVSTGVRGRLSIAPVSENLSALDHDMHTTSLTPSVILECKIPESVGQSFVRGTVTTILNDTVLQASSPFRHAVQLQKIFEDNEEKPNIVLKYTDGGTDQRNTLESVKCANICLFREFDFDMIIAVRCAPGQSFMNPAERIMSILNYGLQNVATERQKMGEEFEKGLQRCNGAKSVREFLQKKPDLKATWTESIETVQSVIRNRFQRLKLKDEPVKAKDPVSDVDIDTLKRHLRELFPDLKLDKLQKAHTSKCEAYMSWKKKHCRETTYTFQIRKCNDQNCCLPNKVMDAEKLLWLPEPVLDASKEHFKKYEEVKNTETTEQDRPSLNVQKPQKSDIKQTETVMPTEQTQEPDVLPAEAAFPTVPMSAQTGRAIATCVECNKPRVVYCRTRLGQRKEVVLATALSEYEYSCGSYLFPPSAPAWLKTSVVIKQDLQCAMPIEVSYYGTDLGRKDLCAHCAQVHAETDTDLKKLYKTVLPICTDCKAKGKAPIVQRPFGKKK